MESLSCYEDCLLIERWLGACYVLQVKLLIEMLIKKCGLDAVKEVMPEGHMKLLTNIRKVSCELH